MQLARQQRAGCHAFRKDNAGSQQQLRAPRSAAVAVERKATMQACARAATKTQQCCRVNNVTNSGRGRRVVARISAAPGAPTAVDAPSQGDDVYDAIIVGAGISGLVTAQALAAKHADKVPNFLVTEARERVGGNITSMSGGGYIWEEGPNSFQPNDAMLQIAVRVAVIKQLSWCACVVLWERRACVVWCVCARAHGARTHAGCGARRCRPLSSRRIAAAAASRAARVCTHTKRRHPSANTNSNAHTTNNTRNTTRTTPTKKTKKKKPKVDAGCADDLVFGDPTAPRFVYWDNKLRPTPSGPDALTFDLLSVWGKVRAGLGAVGIMNGSMPEGREESVKEFIRRNLGDEVFERLIEPFCSGVYAGDPSKLSMEAAFQKIWVLEKMGGSLVGGALKLFQERRANPPAPRDARLPPKPKGQTVGSFREGLQMLPRKIEANLGPGRCCVCCLWGLFCSSFVRCLSSPASSHIPALF
jgi:hypothetical protein